MPALSPFGDIRQLDLVMIVAAKRSTLEASISKGINIGCGIVILIEGKVYQIGWGYPQPVLVIRNPSPPQSRGLVERILRKRDEVYLRGLMIEDKVVLVWDGWEMSHDDVREELFPNVRSHSSDLSLFEIGPDGARPRASRRLRSREKSLRAKRRHCGQGPTATELSISRISRSIGGGTDLRLEGKSGHTLLSRR